MFRSDKLKNTWSASRHLPAFERQSINTLDKIKSGIWPVDNMTLNKWEAWVIMLDCIKALNKVVYVTTL